MVSKTRKVKAKANKSRKSPTASATDFPEGTIQEGNDKHSWVVKKIGSSQRWVPSETAELFGYKRLTVDDLAKHIGKPLTIYEREYCDVWPPKGLCKLQSAVFTSTGDAGPVGREKRDVGWLKTRSPPIKPRTMYTVDGTLMYKGGPQVDGLQVDSVGQKLVSSRLMNTEAFIKV